MEWWVVGDAHVCGFCMHPADSGDPSMMPIVQPGCDCDPPAGNNRIVVLGNLEKSKAENEHHMFDTVCLGPLDYGDHHHCRTFSSPSPGWRKWDRYASGSMLPSLRSREKSPLGSTEPLGHFAVMARRSRQ
ncbi:hypothetical protein ACJ73_04599 [Blastomyces percursus]|uniref:Uncharacterized protein n=1 Tax=Blastomyces percursus TaxID=1658174 RepID=A0A1J9Q673_9EURO|nr:hypothetical protein ACJ73_04599 [Blastomyces percursus]